MNGLPESVRDGLPLEGRHAQGAGAPSTGSGLWEIQERSGAGGFDMGLGLVGRGA